MDVARLWVDAVARALPVILGRRRDAVAVVARRTLWAASSWRSASLTAASCESAATPDAGSRDVLRGPVNALDVLEQADDLGDRLRQRVLELLQMAAIFARTSEPMLPSTRS